MPDAAVHYMFGQQVRGALDADAARYLKDAPFTLALYGPDTWFPYKFWRPRRCGRGRRMHTTHTGAFLTALADQAKNGSCRDLMYSYLAGFLCHYALDSAAHPYIVQRTAETWKGPGCHRTMEHSLDVLELRRAGLWGQRHPVTDHCFPKVSLPEEMSADLDAVYGAVYGWSDCRRTQNRTARVYRMLYRRMENPKGLIARLARLTGSMKLRSLAYSESYLKDADVENLAKQPWRPLTGGAPLTDSFPELREKAKEQAAEMIAGAARYIYGDGDREALAALIGDRSYLSGLRWDDPLNWTVPGLLPSEDLPAERT